MALRITTGKAKAEEQGPFRYSDFSRIFKGYDDLVESVPPLTADMLAKFKELHAAFEARHRPKDTPLEVAYQLVRPGRIPVKADLTPRQKANLALKPVKFKIKEKPDV